MTQRIVTSMLLPDHKCNSLHMCETCAVNTILCSGNKTWSHKAQKHKSILLLRIYNYFKLFNGCRSQ